MTLLVLASFPLFNQPSAVAQSEEGAIGVCVIEGDMCFAYSNGDSCIFDGGLWYGEGSYCYMRQLEPCDSVFDNCPAQSVACCLGEGTCVPMVPDLCIESGGTPSDGVCSEVACDQPCDADVDGDGMVGINDFLDLLVVWGDCS